MKIFSAVYPNRAMKCMIQDHHLQITKLGRQEEMINQKEPLPKLRKTVDYDALFKQLPPLKSRDYIRLLESPDGEKIPPEVLAHCYRQLCEANYREGMEATFRVLTQNGNLRKLRRFIRKMIPPEQNKFDSEDLEQKAWAKIWITLPTKRGGFAENNWLVFAKQRVIDAWNEEFGKKGSKLKTKIGKEKVPIRIAGTGSSGNQHSGEKNAENVDPFERITVDEAAEAAPWHAGLKENEIPLIEKIILETIEKIEEPFLKRLAMDQFGEDPSPISGDRSKSGKAPLTEQTGFERDYISRRIRVIRARLAGALKANKDLKFDPEWLKKFIQNKNKSIKKQTRS